MSQHVEQWKDEMRSVYLYGELSRAEQGTPREALFTGLAAEAGKQAALWEEEARRKGEPLPARFRPELRARVVALLVRRLGPRRLRTVLSAMKVRGMSVYSAPLVSGHPTPTRVEEVGRRHQGAGGSGNLRAAVFGASDGLVSNASLIFGVAGGTPDPHLIVLSGVAGLLAGAFSMAAGEYVSVRSQREMLEYQLGLERAELKEYPEAEAVELALIYRSRGLPEAEALEVAHKMLADPERGLDTLAREELGLNPAELGSPRGAAVYSFGSFAAGAILPLLPFLFGGGLPALILAMVLSALGLVSLGAAISLFTGRRALRGGARQLLIGAAAALATFLIGRLIGVSLA
ncbi:MAG: VIT1/CCC1 transporter family protein [Myxococcaceae bacterium]